MKKKLAYLPTYLPTYLPMFFKNMSRNTGIIFFSLWILKSNIKWQTKKNLTFPLVAEKAEKISQATPICNVSKQNWYKLVWPVLTNSLKDQTTSSTYQLIIWPSIATFSVPLFLLICQIVTSIRQKITINGHRNNSTSVSD